MAAATLTLAWLAGCATPAAERGVWPHVAQFDQRSGGQGLMLTVHGELTSVLPGEVEKSGGWREVLYGPPAGGDYRLRNPQGMALLPGAPSRLLVCDQGNLTVMAIALDSGALREFVTDSQKPRCPVDVTVDDVSGTVFVADTTWEAVLVYDARGRFVDMLKPGEAMLAADSSAAADQPVDRAGQGMSFRPSAVCYHDDVLYVGSIGGGTISRLRLDRERGDAPTVSRLSEWRPPSSYRSALIAPTGMAMEADGSLLIADSVAGVVHHVSSNGTWLPPIGEPGLGRGELVRPKQVACLPALLKGARALVLVSDAGRQSLVVFDSDGRFVGEFGGNMSEPESAQQAEQPWQGWTLPAGLVVLNREDFRPAVLAQGSFADWCVEPDELRQRPELKDVLVCPPRLVLIVSDALGGWSLTAISAEAPD